MKKGDYFEGHIIWDTCSQRKPDVLGLEVTKVQEYDYFTPVVKVNIVQCTCYIASVPNGFKNRHNFWKKTLGYYWYIA